MRYLVPLTLLMAFAACQSDSQSDSLVGAWINTAMRVEVMADSSYVYEADESNWEERMGIKPIRTFFRPDSTYLAEYRGLDGEVKQHSAGRWWTQGDTLTMLQSIPDRIEYKCRWSIEADRATFEMFVDWDGDGEEDDRYLMVQRRL